MTYKSLRPVDYCYRGAKRISHCTWWSQGGRRMTGSDLTKTKKLESMPKPEENVQKWHDLISSWPAQWNQMIDLYFEEKEDEEATRQKNKDCTGQRNECKCDRCGLTCYTFKELASHRWHKHKMRSPIRNYVGDVSECPVCGVDFRSRTRLIKHLMETRVRSRHRTKTCREEFLLLNPKEIPTEVLDRLEKWSAEEIQQARQEGHTNVLARRPCKTSKPHILKGTKRVKTNSLMPLRQVKRRVRAKTPAHLTAYG